MNHKKRRYCAWIVILSLLFNGFACTKAPDYSDFSSLDSSFSSEYDNSSMSGEEDSSDPDVPDSSENSSGDSNDIENPEDTIPSPTPQKTYTKYIRCTAENVRIRAGAGTNYSVIGIAEKGTVYALNTTESGWHQTYYQGKIAYISASYTAVFSLEMPTDTRIEQVLQEGYKRIGVPYVYGAVRLHDGKGNLLKNFTTTKFDCSSLVQYVFYKGANILLNTTTRTQVRQGTYVSPKDLQAGDCIYFTNAERQYKTGIERVGHVAIYLGGNYILHTASDYARIEQISQKRWNFYIEARRFL